MTKRDELTAIRDRIRALRAKAADGASSEAEALTAASMAARLIAKFDILESELGETEADEAVFAEVRTPGSFKAIHPVLRGLGISIARLTETEVWTLSARDLQFCGMPSDVEFATYLAEMLRCAADRGSLTAMMDQPLRKPGKMDMTAFRDGFYLSFVDTLNERIKTLAGERNSTRTAPTARALVSSKKALIRAKKETHGFTLKKNKFSPWKQGNDAGRAAGAAAAARTGLGRPIGSSPTSGPRAIA